MSNIRLNINGREIVSQIGKTMIQAAADNGIEIPHLCYDERIKPYGACGLCVVEMEGSPKLARACATFAQSGQVVKTDTPRTIAARKTALKLLASDHRGDCRPPCMLACPANTDCQGYVGLIANGQFEEALKLVKEKIPVPASIGKICPHPCEEACRRALVEEPISIAALKGFIAEMDLCGEKYLPSVKLATGKRVAVVGAGPAGLAVSFFLTREGHKVFVYEAMSKPGGMLRYGIPQYRLDKNILDAEVELIKKMGVEFIYDTKVGVDVSLAYLQQNYEAIFLGIGSWQSQGLRCKGDDMAGVLGGIDFLREVTRNDNIKLGYKVLVVGGGNTAMDVARTAVRLGASEVTVLYRRTRAEMPAEAIEIEEAEEEGVKYQFLVAPIEVLGENGQAKAIKCEVMKLGDADASGRRKPEPTGELVIYEADRIIAAIGQRTVIGGIAGIATDKSGNIIVEPATFMTSAAKVFAGGDAVTGPKIAIDAIAQGKNAAEVIDSYLKGAIIPHHEAKHITQQDITASTLQDKEKAPRVQLRVEDATVRNKSFMQVAKTFTIQEVLQESKRCLECGCRDYFECKLIKYIQEYDIEVDKRTDEECHNRQEENEHPFIERNADKCVLCGLCVRVCEEVVGATALGLVGRGFESIVKPEFGLPLAETACISCGQCVDICPTGACMEKQTACKQIPAVLEQTASICGYCGIGCNVTVEHKGDMVFRVTPDRAKEGGLLCNRGKFGLGYVNATSRLLKPMIKRDNQFVTASWPEAELEVVKRLQAIVANYGNDSIGIVVSPHSTNEELFAAGKLAEVLNTTVKASYSLRGGSGLAEVFGYDASTNSYDELHNSDFLLSFGDIADNHPVLAMKVKMTEVPQAEWDKKLTDSKELKGFIKALFELGAVDEQKAANKIKGFIELKESLSEIQINKAVRELAKQYAQAKRPLILIDEDIVDKKAVKLLAYAAVLTGKIGEAYRGIILARSNNNSQGTVDMAFRQTACDVAAKIESGKVKALFVIGEDPAIFPKHQELLQKLSFLAVADIFMTETAQIADVVLPLVSIVETEGTYTRSDRKIQEIKAILPPRTGKMNLTLLLELLQNFGVKYVDITSIRQAISAEVTQYAGIGAADFSTEGVYWPNTRQNPGGVQVLYSDGFATSDKKARYVSIEDGDIFKERKTFDTIELYFTKA